MHLDAAGGVDEVHDWKRRCALLRAILVARVISRVHCIRDGVRVRANGKITTRQTRERHTCRRDTHAGATHRMSTGAGAGRQSHQGREGGKWQALVKQRSAYQHDFVAPRCNRRLWVLPKLGRTSYKLATCLGPFV